MTDQIRVPTYSAAQVRSAEAPLLDAGVPLMARAAAALAHVVRGQLPAQPDPDTLTAPVADRARILVLAGSGDNGADALFAAAQLTDHADVDLILTGSRVHAAALAAATAAGAVPHDPVLSSDYDVVIDGIIGIGTEADPVLHGTARTVVTALLPAVRSGRTRVVAVDLPSGLHPDTGLTTDDIVLPAAVTVTFGAVKTGLAAASALTGDIVLVDLGLSLPSDTGAGTATVTRFTEPNGR